MKINKDLADAGMILSAISLVLIGTSEFENNDGLKNILMIVMGILVVITSILRFIPSKDKENHELTD